MAFFEELSKTITDKGKEAAKRAKDLTGALQLKSQVAAEKTKINEAYARIGQIYYEDNQDNQDIRFENDYAMIRRGMAKIEALEEEICQLEGNRICAECGSKVERDAAFCGKCGAPMTVRADESDDIPEPVMEIKPVIDSSQTESVAEEEFTPSEEY